ncbi:CocE/NonD family hydrolase [Nocardia sp. XZ_19_231]|uniref:CocE/NonD family hydrolase n=1 Tax=Nocardia sp. XZ_19_231 TaxID=2769252 RepID=UPI00188FCF9A|nr:CocE/NonD family hydrolase [Nocardia sp. XZ_19_231]
MARGDERRLLPTKWLTSRLVQRAFALDPPLTRDVVVQRDLEIAMPDGVVLLADRWAPRVGGESLPLALYRSPYGRRGLQSLSQGRVMAERGFQVLIQSTRGTFGSGGVFDPLRQEREDGLATLDWVLKQSWFGDSMVLFGTSYLGYVQWAVADSLPPQVKAMVPHVTESALTMEFLRKDGLSLETPFGWGAMIDGQERPRALLRQFTQGRKNDRAMRTLPLDRADLVATGHRVDYIRDIVAHPADASRWDGIDHSHRVAETGVPVSSIGGWYDIFLPGQLRDFTILQQAGRPARLTIGPWTHLSTDPLPIRESLEFGLAHACGQQPPQRAPVRLYVMGAEAWADFETWPPSGYASERYFLHSGNGLSDQPPSDPAGDAEPDRYRYDPADPTPATGGVVMRFRGGGRVDNTALEARPDVLTYSTAVLEQDVEIIGEVSAEIWFRSSLAFADVFVRLCDVHPDGRSFNVCDGLVSLTGADELTCATVELWATAHRFKRGHHIRVQVSSGAFPRYARNTGTAEPRAMATTLRIAEQEIYRGPEHPSYIALPVRQVS